MFRSFLALAAATALAFPALAQDEATTLNKEQRVEAVAALGNAMVSTYVFPEVGEAVAAGLKARIEAGAYDNEADAEKFAELLRADLRELGNDKHLQVVHWPDFKPRGPGSDSPPSAEQIAESQERHARDWYGLRQVRRLPGNIGYIDVHSFGRTEFVAPAYEAAVKLLAGSDAIIIDLRSNGGGSPVSVAQLMSHFFARGDERHINSIYSRGEDRTREFWTDPTVETRYTGPVYVLTSGYTFSGGEEFAYDMQTQERGKLIGEVTGGGANPGSTVPLAHGLVAFIPDGRAINPVTGTNWEHVGVKPDQATSAAEALTTAYQQALEVRIEAEGDSRDGKALEALLERVREGSEELPGWKDPRANRG